jgi:hypothetical protein
MVGEPLLLPLDVDPEPIEEQLTWPQGAELSVADPPERIHPSLDTLCISHVY